MLGSYVGQVVGLRFGEFLGRQIALGACRDDGDDGDIDKRPFRATLASSRLPERVDLRPWMTPVEEQGSIGSCTANALVAALEYLVFRERGQHVDLSRLFVYFNQRLWDDRVREDTGASLVSGIRVLSRVGVPREASWPYQKDLFAVQPPEPVFREASQHRAVDWWSVPVDGDAMRGCLAAGFPVAFGTRVTESFVKTPPSGMCGMPAGADDPRHGRHALLLVGYDDARRVFVVKNSWGDDWGDRGYVYMPYDYVLDPRLTQSGWAIRLTTRDAFDPHQAPAVNAVAVPRAPPEGAGATRTVATVANVGAQIAVGALTGSGLLGGLAGGLLAGLTPGVARVVRGRDRGAFVDRDRSEEILAMLRGPGTTQHRERLPWDDGFDEEAAGLAGTAAAAVAVAAVAVAPRPQPTAPAAAPRPPPSAPAAPPAPSVDFVARLPNRIAEVWREQGGRTGSLGAPISEPVRIHDSGWGGSVVRFEKGGVFVWDAPPDAPPARPFVLSASERAFSRWVELGQGRSPLGWPSAPVQVAADGSTRLLWCTRGVLFDRGPNGVFALFGSLFAHWQSLGGLASDLGHPVADQSVPDDPREPETIRFERGALCWTAARGAWREPLT